MWSVSKKELYGFEGVAAAVFFYMEECFSKGDEKDIYDYFHFIAQKQTLKTLIAQISTILTDDIELSKDTQNDIESAQIYLDKNVCFKKHYLFEVNKKAFMIEIEDETLKSPIYPELKHLQTDNKNTDFLISITGDIDKGYDIYVNSIRKQTIINRANILSALYDHIRITHYQLYPFLIALHAATLKYKDTMIVFPGVSQSGKSTLATYLMHKGFTLFSDELTVLDDESYITPLPLGTTLKEGSWDVMKPIVEELDRYKHHLRFDGQKIKSITPPHIEQKRIKTENFLFIFPTFKRNTPTEFHPISTTKALKLFIDSGYHLSDSTSFRDVYRWLKILSQAKLYTLTYSNIEDAHKRIKEVLKR